MRYKNFLFDWSGTLVDDLPPTLHATNLVLHSHGVEPLDREEFRRRFRLPYPEFYEEMIPGVAIEELEDSFRAGFRASPVGVAPLPGSMEILAFLEEKGARCFVLSSMDATLLEAQAEDFRLAGYFEAVYSAVIDKRTAISKIIQHHGLVPEETVFVGDMVHDIDAARVGKVGAISLLTGYDPQDRLQAAQPDALFANLADLQHSLTE